MPSIIYIDRQTQERKEEQVYGSTFLELLYGSSFWSRFVGRLFLPLFAKWPFFSSIFGYFQRKNSSKKKIVPFIKKYGVDTSSFLEPVEHFSSFNDFFIRKLKPESRPIFPGDEAAIIPADGRYLFYPEIDRADGFVVKGKKFCLKTLLEDKELASHYAKGSMVIARLCPTDYHRFHFPCDCIPSNTKLINGWLYSVNPIAVKRNIEIFTQNKRTLCMLESSSFGKVLFLEIGATAVGSIYQTYQSGQFYLKGAEKGYFGFGASSLILIFEPGKIIFDPDLLAASKDHLEILCLMGQSMGSKQIQ